MRNRLLLKSVLLILISASSFIFTSYLGSLSFLAKEIIGGILYFLGLIFLYKKYPNYIIPILTICSLPHLLVFIIFNILEFKNASVSFSSNLFVLVSCLASYFFYKKQKKIIPISLVILLIFLEIGVQKAISNAMIYGTINQKVSMKAPLMKLYDSTGLQINLENENRIVVLDFWTSACIVCYQQMPLVNDFNKTLDKKRFAIKLVNVPTRNETREKNIRLLNKYHYSIEQLFCENNAVPDSVGIRAYPTTIVIKNNTIVFRGEFENAMSKLNDF